MGMGGLRSQDARAVLGAYAYDRLRHAFGIEAPALEIGGEAAHGEVVEAVQLGRRGLPGRGGVGALVRGYDGLLPRLEDALGADFRQPHDPDAGAEAFLEGGHDGRHEALAVVEDGPRLRVYRREPPQLDGLG